MKSRLSLISILGLLLLTFVSLPAQERGRGTPMQNMSMQDMMTNCKEHCQKTTASIDQLLARIDEAKKSNDPAQMRSALDGAQKPLAEMKQHMNMCMSMMSVMGNMGQNQPRAAHPTSPGQAQTVRIAVTNKGFEPANINLKPNVPAKVTFIRQTDQTCATSVVIPEYKINRELPLNKPVVVEFTPTKTGEFTFACGMNMLKGKVVVQESR
jgi:plastocyanin